MTATAIEQTFEVAAPVGLRRADWRFLLPAPPDGMFQHLVLLGGLAELAEQIAVAGIARQVSCHPPPAGTADAVAVLQGAGLSPAHAASYLAPGGALYYEIDRRTA